MSPPPHSPQAQVPDWPAGQTGDLFTHGLVGAGSSSTSPMPTWPPAADLPFTPLDLAFARFVDESASAGPVQTWLAALVSHQWGRGHACLDLEQLALHPTRVLGWPQAACAALPAGLHEVAAGLPAAQGDGAPLVWQAPRLYLRRAWVAEQQILAAVHSRLAQGPQPEDEGDQHDCHWAASLDTLFPGAPPVPGEPDWQKVACALATRGHLTLITGGPGTGKTTTVVRLLALWLAQHRRQGGGAGQTGLRIHLAAPTGKAAARLASSIAQAAQHLPPGWAEGLPTQAQTLHRLLGLRPDTQGQAPALLATDLVVVDEASMIDLEMMARLLAALPPLARLVLLGDKDQLASVEAGAVMGQLCDGAEAGGYDAATCAWLARVTGQDLSPWQAPGAPRPLAQHTVMLRHSRRFDAHSGIGHWARAVNAGALGSIKALWQGLPAWPAADQDVDRLAGTGAQLSAVVRQGWQAWRQGVLALMAQGQGADDTQALALLQALTEFQVLCALRDGTWGVDHLNTRVAQALDLPTQGWYAGRPVMLSRNDYGLGLMNGDIGLCLPRRGPEGQALGLRVAFADGQGGVRWVLPSRLDAVDTVWAMTVHKSQGSEFGHVLLVLPGTPSPVLTRELVYTGLTRAKQRLSFWVPDEAVLWQACQRRVLRAGGLGA